MGRELLEVEVEVELETELAAELDAVVNVEKPLVVDGVGAADDVEVRVMVEGKVFVEDVSFEEDGLEADTADDVKDNIVVDDTTPEEDELVEALE